MTTDNLTLPEVIKRDKINQLVTNAQLVLKNEINIIEASRKIAHLIMGLGLKDNFLLPIIGFESQTDHFPLGELRNKYNTQALEKLDKEQEEYIREFEPQVKSICEEIIKRFS